MYGSLILQQDKLIYIFILQRPFNTILFFVDWMNWHIFGISDSEAKCPDLQQKLLLECTKELWREAVSLLKWCLVPGQRFHWWRSNEQKRKQIFLRAIQLSYTKWFCCVWLVSMLDHQAFASTVAKPKNYLLSSASTVFSRVTYETSTNYSDIWKRLLTLPEAAWNEGQSTTKLQRELHIRTSGRLSRFGLL